MKDNKTKKNTLKRLISLIKPYMGLVILSFVFALATVFITLFFPVITGNAIDIIAQLKGEDLKEGLIKSAVTLLILICAGALSQWLMGLVNNRLSYSVSEALRKLAMEKIQRLPLSYLDNKPVGDIVSRVINDVDQISDGLLLGFSQLFTGILTILGTLIFMISKSGVVAIIVIVVTPLSLFAAGFISKKSFNFFTEQAKIRGEQTAFIDEMVGGEKVVKSMGRGEEAVKSFNEINDRFEKCARMAVFYSSLTNPVTRFVNSIVYALVVVSGSFFVIGGSLTVGGLSCLLNYAGQYTKPFNEISGVITEFQNALACAGRLFEFIDEKERLREEENAYAPNVEDIKGEVSLENVAFSYVPDKKLIENFNLKVKPGEKVAIVGPTGCGKTTLINLLMRFYDVNEGSIKEDGRDIRTFTRKALRRGYGMVLQETWLKNGTIKENIAMGRPEATEEEIISAAKAAHCHGFIKRMEKGYDTVINEDGGELSQGQKQLLCIARVMLTLPPMLILDEATSSIDTRTEIKIQDAFSKMMEGRTSFIVAHRLSTIKNADTILVMNNGAVVEQGNHESLLAKGGFYYNLYNSQFAK